MGEEAKLMEAYSSAKKLMEEAEELLAKFEFYKESYNHINYQFLDSIHDCIAQIQSLCRDMKVTMLSSPDSISNRKLWQSRENLVSEKASSMNLRLQKLLEELPPEFSRWQIVVNYIGIIIFVFFTVLVPLAQFFIRILGI